jgi:hypothetical protein
MPIIPAPLPPGVILDYGGATAPSGFLLCDGAAVSRTEYVALFDAIGTTYGAGDGSTTFNVPDFRGRVAVGVGTHTDVNNRGESDAIALANRRPNQPTTGPSATTNVSALLGGTPVGTSGHTHTTNIPFLTIHKIIKV